MDAHGLTGLPATEPPSGRAQPPTGDTGSPANIPTPPPDITAGTSGAADTPRAAGPKARGRRLIASTSLQVLVAAIAAAVFGIAAPHYAAGLQPLANIFISLVQLVIAPIVFLVIVTGIVTAGELKSVGRVALKALLYFEIVTTIGMLLGLAAVNLLHPGSGVPKPGHASDQLSSYVSADQHNTSLTAFLSKMVPSNAVGAFATGGVLQVLIFAVLFAVTLLMLPKTVSDPITRACAVLSTVFFKMIALIMLLAPIGTFGAVAATVGKYGPETLTALVKLVLVSILALVVFILVVLGIVARLAGFRLLRLIRVLRKELLVVLGTASSEAVLPQLMERLETVGCRRKVIGLVVPAGFSFNLDGVAVVVPICVIFIGQVYGVPLTGGDQLTLFAIFLVLSKGTAGVSGSAFVTLANTVAATSLVPIAGLALVLSVDRFLSVARAATNVLGNAVATVVVARFEPDGLDRGIAAREIGMRPAKSPVPQPEQL
ncbi:cation:dicarboxylase symporter family transporter [Nocardia sp. ET3-3]|uniref:Cation:dicarboxylase symporter family transporter n=1 Tax=Nocardia terrae TaxID=2675851 RepID=A0A7K1V1S5_9NOCA|nr:cation:dicarboxylase symporter family transporter [Nocardia terrae]MVU80586.1 cation:dicarboxylase symporter family transporter [Nocardia terrae]